MRGAKWSFILLRVSRKARPFNVSPEADAASHSVLSPWIKRALLAGGFGTGEIVGERPLEVAPVVFAHGEPVPVGFERRAFSPPTSPPNGPDDSNAPRDSTKRLADLETGLQQFSQKGTWSSSDDTSSEEAGPVVSTLHSRFHLDLPSAVAAAAGGQRW